MTTLVKTFRFALLVIAFALVSACTDNRPALPQGLESNFQSLGPLYQVGDVIFGGKATSTYQMAVQGGSLFLTGAPFLFMRWDIMSDPEQPRQLYAGYDNILDFSPDPPFGGWTVGAFGANALTILGNYAFSSGSLGMSSFQIGPSSTSIQEIGRFPNYNQQTGQPQSDPKFQYQAMAANPAGRYVYGMTAQDGIYKIDVSQPNNARLISLSPYSNTGPVCCATGATVFANQLFVAMRAQVRVYNFLQDGGLQLLRVSSALNPVAITSTAKYVYIHHQPTSNGNVYLQAGIYVYDMAGSYVNYFPIAPLSFAVAPDDQHVYSNEDDQSIKIYRVQWTNSSYPATF